MTTLAMVADEQRAWRCRCRARTLFGHYTLAGNLQLRRTRRNPEQLPFDIVLTRARTHCPVCHREQELRYDEQRATFTPRSRHGPRRGGPCTRCAESADG